MSLTSRLRSLKFETIGSISAIVIGACALFVALEQARVMRAQQHAIVWPVLDPEFAIQRDAESPTLELVLFNAGVGPALVKSVSIGIDGAHADSWSDVEASLFRSPPDGDMQLRGEDVEGSVLAPGERIRIARLIWPKSEATDAAFASLVTRYTSADAPALFIDACYCSVFRRCWRTGETGHSERVKACPAPTGFFSTFFVRESGEAEPETDSDVPSTS